MNLESEVVNRINVHDEEKLVCSYVLQEDYSKFNIIQHFEVFQSDNDFIYSQLFRDYCYYELIKYGNFVNTEKYGTTHTECFDFISKFIIKKVLKNIKFKDTEEKNNEHNDGAKRLRI